MSSITLSTRVNDHPHMRPMNMFRDLTSVADLIELCFSETMDNDGQRYIADMRRAGADEGFLKWASRMTETASLPLTGFVWEEDNRIVGNASLIPFRDKGRRIYLVANIAVHPDYRRRGIARTLTQHAMQYGWDKKALALWLHVRDDNPGAITLYESLGFRELARRTTWVARKDPTVSTAGSDIQILPREPRFWPQQQDWLRRIHPESLSWYHTFNFNSLRPGLLNTIYMFLTDHEIRQWVAVRGDDLLSVAAFVPGRAESLFIASSDDRSEPEALTRLLLHVRHVLSDQMRLMLEYPAGEMRDALIDAGFAERRTLLWMRADR